jgi:hypothetical protein
LTNATSASLKAAGASAPVDDGEADWGSDAGLLHDDVNRTVAAAAARRARNDFTTPPYRIPLRGIRIGLVASLAKRIIDGCPLRLHPI